MDQHGGLRSRLLEVCEPVLIYSARTMTIFSVHMFVDYQWYKWQALNPRSSYPGEATGLIVDRLGTFLGSTMVARTSDWQRLSTTSSFQAGSGIKMVSGQLQILVLITKVPITTTPHRVDLVYANKVLGSSSNLAMGNDFMSMQYRNATVVVTDAYNKLVEAGADPEQIEASASAVLVDTSGIGTPLSSQMFWEWLTVYQ
jgi:hypothetical protein